MTRLNLNVLSLPAQYVSWFIQIVAHTVQWFLFDLAPRFEATNDLSQSMLTFGSLDLVAPSSLLKYAQDVFVSKQKLIWVPALSN